MHARESHQDLPGQTGFRRTPRQMSKGTASSVGKGQRPCYKVAMRPSKVGTASFEQAAARLHFQPAHVQPEMNQPARSTNLKVRDHLLRGTSPLNGIPLRGPVSPAPSFQCLHHIARLPKVCDCANCLHVESNHFDACFRAWNILLCT